MKELKVTPKIKASKQARELARIWDVDGDQTVIFDDKLWDDPATWGIFLADFSRHIAQAYQANTGGDIKAHLQRIKEGYLIEMAHPTNK